MRFLFRLVFLLVILIGIAWAVSYSGFYNVAASQPEPKFMQSFYMMTMDHSVEHHAKGISAPNNLEDTAVIHKGFEHFQEMCVQCHGAPGVKKSEMAEGLNPRAPKLLWSAKEDSPAEIYWIVKNGIKMTGMPGFGVTHDEEELWAITAFVKQLPNIDSATYADMQQKWCDKGGADEDKDCEKQKIDCERQSDGTRHHPGPPQAIR